MSQPPQPPQPIPTGVPPIILTSQVSPADQLRNAAKQFGLEVRPKSQFTLRALPNVIPGVSCPSVGGSVQHQYRVGISVQEMMDRLPPGQQLPAEVQIAIKRYPALYKHAIDMGCAALGGEYDSASSVCMLDACPLTPEQVDGNECIAYKATYTVDGTKVVGQEVGFCVPTKETLMPFRVALEQQDPNVQSLKYLDRLEAHEAARQAAVERGGGISGSGESSTGGGGGGGCTIL
jgi:hypothetical protein